MKILKELSLQYSGSQNRASISYYSDQILCRLDYGIEQGRFTSHKDRELLALS